MKDENTGYKISTSERINKTSATVYEKLGERFGSVGWHSSTAIEPILKGDSSGIERKFNMILDLFYSRKLIPYPIKSIVEIDILQKEYLKQGDKERHVMSFFFYLDPDRVGLDAK